MGLTRNWRKWNGMAEVESACKPGFVEDGHSSGIAVTGDFKRPTRKHGGTPAAPRGATSLFGLAPGGVCRAAGCCHRRGALLPHRFTLASLIAEASAVCFLLHFPSAHAAQALPGTSSAGARTFLHISREMQRPSGRLRAHHSDMHKAPQVVRGAALSRLRGRFRELECPGVNLVALRAGETRRQRSGFAGSEFGEKRGERLIPRSR